MASIKEKDFVEIEYTGRIKEDSIIFDTTDEKIAKDNGLFDQKMPYAPVSICIGQNMILAGLDENLIGKEAGKSYTIELNPEKAFGKKDPKLLKIVNTNVFRKENIDPVAGLQVNIDGMLGTIKTVTGGRTVVDFNHPLSGKDVVYEVKINRIITDDSEKIKSFVSLQFNLKPGSFTVSVDENKNAVLKFEEGIKLKHFNLEKMTESLQELVGIRKVGYEERGAKEQPKQPETTQK